MDVLFQFVIFLCHVTDTWVSVHTSFFTVSFYLVRNAESHCIMTIQNLGKNNKKLNLTHGDGSKQLNSAVILHQ